jgi:serine protease inhibitor ecotin
MKVCSMTALWFPLRDNRRWPIVDYVPEGVEVRYRLWTAAAELKALDKG